MALKYFIITIIKLTTKVIFTQFFYHLLSIRLQSRPTCWMDITYILRHTQCFHMLVLFQQCVNKQQPQHSQAHFYILYLTSPVHSQKASKIAFLLYMSTGSLGNLFYKNRWQEFHIFPYQSGILSHIVQNDKTFTIFQD